MCCRQFKLNLEVDLDNDPGAFNGSTPNRKATDVLCLITTGIFLVILIRLTVYCIRKSDIDKLMHGYDDCGNICGKNNTKIDSIPFQCFGKNMVDKKYNYIYETSSFEKRKQCLTKCNNSTELNYCILTLNDAKLLPFYILFVLHKRSIILPAIITVIILVFVFLGLNIIDAKAILQLTIVLILSGFLALLWGFVYISWDSPKLTVFASIAVIASLASVVIIPSLFTARMSVKIHLTYKLLQELRGILNQLHLYCLLPLISLFVITMFVFLFIYCLVRVETFSYLEEIDELIDYVQHPLATIIESLLIYAFLFLYEMVKNSQCMIVGGYVAQWYFTRKTGKSSNYTRKTIKNMLKYHLGSLCCGSMILSIITPMRIVVNAINGATSGTNKHSIYACPCRFLSETCLAAVTTSFSVISQNGLIMTAIYGCGFCAGTLRAEKLLTHNIFNAGSLYTFGDWLLVYLKFIVWFISFAVVSLKIFLLTHHDLVAAEFILFFGSTMFSYIIAEFFFSVYEVTKDTLLLCFCEDCLWNNGASKPYHMTPEFAQYIENANLFVDPVKWGNVAGKWAEGPKRVYLNENV